MSESVLTSAVISSRETQAFVRAEPVSRASFRNANLSGLRLEDTEWTECDFSEADFVDFRCRSCAFDRSRWVGAALDEAMMMDTTITEGVFDDILWRNGMLTASSCDGASFRNADLSGTEMIGCTFIGANLEGAQLRGVNAKGCVFRKAVLTGVDFTGSNLIGADFRGATLRDVVWTGAQISEALFDAGCSPV